MDTNEKNLRDMLENVSNTVRCNVAACVEAFSNIKWKKVSFIIPTAPKPSQRPRLSGYRIYVPGAAKNATFFNNNVLPELKGLFITTPCKIKSDIYIETPASFTKTQKCLAEMKILRPWAHTGDIDNFLKSTMDSMLPNEKRGHTGIMYDDCLVIDASTKKYYSKTPRTEVTIYYMDDKKISDQIKKILRMNVYTDKYQDTD